MHYRVSSSIHPVASEGLSQVWVIRACSAVSFLVYSVQPHSYFLQTIRRPALRLSQICYNLAADCDMLLPVWHLVRVRLYSCCVTRKCSDSLPSLRQRLFQHEARLRWLSLQLWLLPCVVCVVATTEMLQGGGGVL